MINWAKDQQVALRLKEIWPNIVKIINYRQKLPPSKQPLSKSYLAVKKAVEDNLIVAKFSFFSCIASLLSIRWINQCYRFWERT